MKGQKKPSHFSYLLSDQVKTSLSKSASCLEVAEGKLEKLLEKPVPSSSKLREKVFVSVFKRWGYICP